MNTFKGIMAGFLMAALVFSGSAFAAQKASDQTTTTAAATETQGDAVMRKHPDKHNGPLEMLGRFQFENMAIKTISELTSQPVETVAAKLKQDRLPKVLRAYNITRDAFQAAMKPKFIALVHRRVEDGSITSAQEALVLEALEKQGSRHAVMEKLIKNGVTSGIITQKEADRMLSRGDEKPPAE